MSDEKKYPQNHSDPEPDPSEMMQGVYAGPAFFQKLNTQMFMAVYAGPPLPPDAEPIGAPGPEQTGERLRWCPNCLASVAVSAKFCTECGTPLPPENA